MQENFTEFRSEITEEELIKMNVEIEAQIRKLKKSYEAVCKVRDELIKKNAGRLGILKRKRA